MISLYMVRIMMKALGVLRVMGFFFKDFGM